MVHHNATEGPWRAFPARRKSSDRFVAMIGRKAPERSCGCYGGHRLASRAEECAERAAISQNVRAAVAGGAS